MISRFDKLKGTLEVSPSKSYAQRYLLAALYAPGSSFIGRPGLAEDTLAMKKAVEQLGAKVAEREGGWKIRGGLQLEGRREISCGESGLAARLLIPAAALRLDQTDLLLEGSLRSRPFAPYAEFFKGAGLNFVHKQGRIRMEGGLKAGRYFIDAGMSSQFVSGLLMAMPMLEGDSRLQTDKTVSSGYIAMTLEVMDRCGIELTREEGCFKIPGGQSYRPFEREIEGDWSAAAVMAIAGALNGSIVMRGLNRKSLQPDSRILEILDQCGAKFGWRDGELSVERDQLRPFEFDATDCPDLIPGLAVLACFCSGESVIGGTHRLRHKESDRASAMKHNLESAGYHPVLEGDQLRLQGGPQTDARTLCRWKSFDDHRILMAGLLFSLGSGRPVLLDDVHCTRKSWPDFYNDMKSLGAKFDE